jgi:hypothetical protein
MEWRVPSQDSLQGIILGSLAAIPLLYCLQEGLVVVLSHQIDSSQTISEILSEGKNINCDDERQNNLTIESLKNSLVCIEGIVQPMAKEETFTSLDDTECVLILEAEYQNKKLSNRKIRQKPWCLGSWERKDSLQGKCVVIDHEALRRWLESEKPPPVSLTNELEFSSINTILRPGGKTLEKRLWWDFFSSDHLTTQKILPTMTRCCFVGRLVLNSDGNFLLTTHHTLGFLPFTSISFAAASSDYREWSLTLQTVSSVCKWSFGFLRLAAGCVFVGATAIYFARKYHIFPFVPPNNGGTEDSEESEVSLEEENEEAEEEDDFPRIQSTLCVICLDLQRNVLIQPCKHFCLCENCAQSVQQCPVCRNEIRSQEVVYNV